MSGTESLRIFRVLREEGRTRVETDGDVLGWGVEFPNGACYVDWNRHAYPPENRLEHPHVSQYGCFADVEQGTGGVVDVLDSLEVSR